jgi:hypothetical protein
LQLQVIGFSLVSSRLLTCFPIFLIELASVFTLLAAKRNVSLEMEESSLPESVFKLITFDFFSLRFRFKSDLGSSWRPVFSLTILLDFPFALAFIWLGAELCLCSGTSTSCTFASSTPFSGVEDCKFEEFILESGV